MLEHVLNVSGSVLLVVLLVVLLLLGDLQFSVFPFGSEFGFLVVTLEGHSHLVGSRVHHLRAEAATRNCCKVRNGAWRETDGD